MAKAVFVTYLIALSVISTWAYKKECAAGPEYWCKSFETAQDCGALRHCTDTTWRYDAKQTKIDGSTACEWCQKILANSHKGIQDLTNNEDLMISTLSSGCNLFPLTSSISKCNNAIEKYGSSVVSLMKNQRYATLCRLMDICSNDKPSDTEPSTTEKPIMLGQKRCTWGPAYWCSSLSNTRECGAIEHCSSRVWSKQSIEKKPNDNICQYCEFTIEKLRTFIEEQKLEMSVEKWLSGACSMLPTKETIDECVQMMSQYADEILVVIKNNIDPGVICHLAHMCKEATIITRVEIETPKAEEKKIIPANNDKITQVPIDEQSKMLCNVIVRATHHLHKNERKNRDDIQIFLQNDCKKLASNELIEKCENLVRQYGTDIHGYVTSNIELSKICDYLDNFVDHTALQSLPNVHCELCTFVLTTVKYMLQSKDTEDKVLLYIDDQICSRSTGLIKKNCKSIIENHGKALIDSIQQGTNSMLLCTHFQVCLNQVFDKTSPINKNERNSFIKENICQNLGPFQQACNALIEKDPSRLMYTLVNDMEGDVLCGILGTCPKKLSFLDNLAVNDDKNKCQRCVDDFTRRKHIAEKLVNHSSEFLHHLCGQLPDKDDCLKTVDESINELVTFIRSMDPQDICVKLNYCNATMLEFIEPTRISSTDDEIGQQVIQYIKVEICSKLGALAELCKTTIDMEGPTILPMIAKNIDAKKACTTIGVCPGTSAFENCNDKCECCLNKIEVHEVQIATFMRSMVESIKNMCQRMPQSEKCLEMTTQLDSNVNRITSRFNAKRVCQILNHCSNTPIEIESLPDCQKRIDSKKEFLLSSINSINNNLKSLCEYIPWNKDCYGIIDRSTLDVSDKLTKLNSETVCTASQSLTDLICTSNSPFEKLCKQLVEFNENSSRMEAIFKSMFNQNGHVEKVLCEIEYELQSSDCKPSVTIDNCANKCDCCVQFYGNNKDYDLKMIESLRSGLLAACDWSLSKDYCISWFNRVCDRMKDKVDRFTPTAYCKQIGVCSINKQECKIDGDKCQCCNNRLNARQNRFRTTVDGITTTLLSVCKDDADCRSLVQSAQQQSIDQINRINSQSFCQRYGYCLAASSSQADTHVSRLLANSYQNVGSAIEALDDRLEAALSSDICFQYGQLKPLCEHLLSSSQGQRYAYVYMAVLKNNPKFINDDLREQMATDVNANVCDSCKSAVESSKDFLNNALDSVLNSLLRTCERCPAKDQCRDFYNQQYNNIKSYVNGIDADQFCQSIHLCATSSINSQKDQCSTCVDSLQTRKVTALQAVDRVVSYFDDLCQRFAGPQCQVFLKQIQESFENSIQNFDPKQTCSVMGFCSTENNKNQMTFGNYEKFLEDEIDKNICSMLGPFESLCKQTIRANRKQVQTVKINYNIKDLMMIGEKMKKNFFNAANLNQCNRDKCECCVKTVDQKKQCMKSMGDNMIQAFIQSCDYCPSKDQCQKYWKDYQSRFDSCIDDIDSKQVCTRLGYCNASLLCKNMGIFQESCEEALAAFTQSLQHDQQTLEDHLPHTSVVVLPTKTQDDLLNDSNATCILCEYAMEILSHYVHENSTEDEIEQYLQKVCNDMPSTLRKQCLELVDDYGPVIISMLIQEFDAKTICQKLNLCTKQMKVYLSHLTKPSPSSCGVCDYVSTYIRFALKRDSSEKSFEQALSTVCTRLSNEHNIQCQTLVQLFRPQFRKLKLDLNNNFCQELTICQTPATNDITGRKPSIIHVALEKDKPNKQDDQLKNTIINNVDVTPQCMLCKYVVSYLDAVLKTNKSEAAIEAALEKVCTTLPAKERGSCENFVKTYGPVLAELIAELADADAICRYLGMCQVSLPRETTATVTEKPKTITYGNHDYARLSPEDTPFTCTICQYLISRMKHFAALNQTEEEIIASLKQSCDAFSVLNLKQQCNDFLDKYAPYIIQMISSDVDPKAACQSMKLCESKVDISSSTHRQSTPPTSVASSTKYGKCIFGMSYWCTSRQNAELCNAVELCQRQVWSKRNKNIVI